MKKICLSFIVLLLIGVMLLFGCSNSATQINNAVDSSVASETQQKQIESQKSLNPKLVEIYNNGIKGYVKFDKDGKLWEKYNGSDQIRETSELIDYNIYRIYETDTKKTEYVSTIKTNMNNNTVLSEEYEKVIDNSSTKISIDEYNEIKNIFESMKDYYDEFASGNALSNKSPSNTKLNKLETVNKSIGDVHYKYGNVIKVLKVIDIGDYKIDNLYSLSKDQYRLVFNDEYKNHFLDLKGNISINEKWKNYKIYNIVNSELAIVQDEETKKYGIIDKNGNYVLNPDYSHIHSQDGGKYYFVVKNDKLNMLDNVFNKMFECDYYEFKPINVGNNKVGQITNYYNDLLNIFNGNKWGYLDLKGNVVIDYKYDIAGAFNKQGYSSVVSKNINGENKYGLIDKNDNIIIDFQYDKYLSFGVDGISRANKDDEAYYINLDNKKVLQGLLFEGTNIFSEGLAFVKKEGKWGIIDTNGREVFPCIFDIENLRSESTADNYRFNNGIAYVTYKNKILLITYLEPSACGFTYDDVNNAYSELAAISGNSDLWNNLNANLLDKIEKNNWTEDDYKNDLKYTMTYKSIQPNSWYATGAGVWYYFENDRTTTKKGWFVDNRDEQTYYLDTNTGRMAVGWTDIDGDMYYFNESHDNEPNWYEIGNGFYESYGKKVKAYGSMFIDETTPDGKRVDSDGKLIK